MKTVFFLEIARNVSAKLAESVATQKHAWEFAPGVVLFPDVRCPYCKKGLRGNAIWKVTDTRLIGQVIPVAGRMPELENPDHPHARQDWSGKICLGGATGATHALFGALNGTDRYRPYVLPWLRGPFFNHTCREMGLQTCSDCRGWIEDGKGRQFLQKWYCRNCFDKRAYRCSDCHNYYPHGDQKTSPITRNIICRHCSETGYFKCFKCQNHHRSYTTIKALDGNKYCADCWTELFFSCGVCAISFDKKVKHYTPLGVTYCWKCYHRKVMKKCPRCDVRYNTQDYYGRMNHVKCPIKKKENI